MKSQVRTPAQHAQNAAYALANSTKQSLHDWRVFQAQRDASGYDKFGQDQRNAELRARSEQWLALGERLQDVIEVMQLLADAFEAQDSERERAAALTVA